MKASIVPFIHKNLEATIVTIIKGYTPQSNISSFLNFSDPSSSLFSMYSYRKAHSRSCAFSSVRLMYISSRESDIIQLGVENEIITKSGSFYSYGETRLGQGKEAVKQFLKDNDKMSKEIESKVISIINHEDNQN